MSLYFFSPSDTVVLSKIFSKCMCVYCVYYLRVVYGVRTKCAGREEELGFSSSTNALGHGAVQ